MAGMAWLAWRGVLHPIGGLTPVSTPPPKRRRICNKVVVIVVTICHLRQILPELLFERYHGLDHRPIDEMAHAYLKGPWMDFIGSSTRVRVPTTPAIREFVHRMAMREFGETSANRLHATFALWAIHPEREYESCAPEVWARSLSLIHI